MSAQVIADSGTPRPGMVLGGKYVVESILGVGGMAAVVSARHLQLDQRVAIKYLLPAALSLPRAAERFEREARAAARVRGAHVVRVLDVGTFDDGAPYMVLEHLEGVDLEHFASEHGPLPVMQAVGFVLQACVGIAEAHHAGIVHRDIKPSNLFLARQPDRRSIVKMLDFGISKVCSEANASLTGTLELLGTPYFMSPEQLLATKNVDARTDIWALGVVLYQLLSGRIPFGGETLPEIIAGVLHNVPAPLETLRADIPASLCSVVARCLRSKPEERYRDIAELARALAVHASARDAELVDAVERVSSHSMAPPPRLPSEPPLVLELRVRTAPSPPAAPAIDTRPSSLLATLSPAYIAHGDGPPGTLRGLSPGSMDVELPKRRTAWRVVASLVVGVAVVLVGARTTLLHPGASSGGQGAGLVAGGETSGVRSAADLREQPTAAKARDLAAPLASAGGPAPRARRQPGSLALVGSASPSSAPAVSDAGSPSAAPIASAVAPPPETTPPLAASAALAAPTDSADPASAPPATPAPATPAPPAGESFAAPAPPSAPAVPVVLPEQ